MLLRAPRGMGLEHCWSQQRSATGVQNNVMRVQQVTFRHYDCFSSTPKLQNTGANASNDKRVGNNTRSYNPCSAQMAPVERGRLATGGGADLPWHALLELLTFILGISGREKFLPESEGDTQGLDLPDFRGCSS